MAKCWWNFPLRKESLAGKVIYQPEKGYRYSLEAFLLSSFVSLRPGERALELGAGCGIITLLLSWRYPDHLFWGLEIQPPLLWSFARNVKENGLVKRVLPVAGDVKAPPFKPGAFDVVFSNPPFYPLASGRLSPDLQERCARHEILASLEDFLKAAAFLLRNKGRFYLICAADRIVEVFSILVKNRLEPKCLRLVHSYPGDVARLFLLEAVKGAGRELKILPPLFIYHTRGGAYSEEVVRAFQLAEAG